MPDVGARVLVAEPGPISEAFTYTVPGTQAIRLRTISALWDGSDTFEPWVPAVSIYAQSGELLSRTLCRGVSVEPGEVAEATFAPFLGEARAATPAPPAQVPYVAYVPEVTIPSGTDPDPPQGRFYIAMPTPPFTGTDPATVLMGQGEVRFNGSVGITGSGDNGVYVLSPTTPTPGLYGFTNGAIGAGVTYPGGVPYPCFLVQAGFGMARLKVAGVADPDASEFQYCARPDWPGAYEDGDTLFEGIWNGPVRVD